MSISVPGSYIIDFSANPTEADFSSVPFSGTSAYGNTFSGTLDGNGVTLTGLSVALFNSLGDGSVIKNLGLATATYTPVESETPASGGVTTSGSISNTAGVLANSASGEISINNVQVSGGINSTSEYVGGLIGSVSGSVEIVDSTVNLDVTGRFQVGGMVGQVSNDLEVTGSHFTGNLYGATSSMGGLAASAATEASSSIQISGSTVSGSVHSSGWVAGLVANTNYDVNVSSTFVNGNITSDGNMAAGLIGYSGNGIISIEDSGHTGNGSSNTCAGGFVACTNGDVRIVNSINIGSVVAREHGTWSSDANAGGLVATATHVYIENSTQTGAVQGVGDMVGGLVGRTTSGGTLTVLDSNQSGSITGQNSVGGLVGFSNGAATITNSSSSSNVTSGNYSGGLVGQAASTISILDSSHTGAINAGGASVGGLVGLGYDSITISRSSNTGSISSGRLVHNGSHGDPNSWVDQSSAGWYCGPFNNYLCLIASGYYADSISNPPTLIYEDNVGGLVGNSIYSLNIQDSYNEGQVNGGNQTGGLVGNSGGSTTILNSEASGTVSSQYSIYDGQFDLNSAVETSYPSTCVDANGIVSSCFSTDTHYTTWIDSYITSYKTNVGGLVGNSTGTLSISNSKSQGGVIGGGNVGGLVGRSEIINIDNSGNYGNVSSQQNAGGLIGYADNFVTINSSRNRGWDIRGKENGGSGGLIGWANNGLSIVDSYSRAGVAGFHSTLFGNAYEVRDWYTNNIGGLVGYASGLVDINRSYSEGGRLGNTNIGGLVGQVDGNLTIANSLSMGSVFGFSNVGSLIGKASGTISNSFGLANCYTECGANSQVATQPCELFGESVGGLTNLGGTTLDCSTYNPTDNEEIIASTFNVILENRIAPICGPSHPWSEITNPSSENFIRWGRCDFVSFGNPYLTSEFTSSPGYTVRINPGSQSSDSAYEITHRKHETINVPDAPTSSAGLRFISWNTASNRSGFDYAPGDSYYPISESTTLYAIWEDNTVDPAEPDSGGNNGSASLNINNDPALTKFETKIFEQVKDFSEILNLITESEKPLAQAILTKLTLSIKEDVEGLPTDVKSWVAKMELKSSVELLTSFSNPASQAISIMLNDQLREFIGVDNFKEIFASGENLDIETLNKIFTEKFGFSLDDWLTGIGIPFLMQLMLA